MTLCLSANYNDTVVKLNLKKLRCVQDLPLSYLVELAMAFLQLEHTPIWFERKKKPWSCMADNAFVPGTRNFFFLNNF